MIERSNLADALEMEAILHDFAAGKAFYHRTKGGEWFLVTDLKRYTPSNPREASNLFLISDPYGDDIGYDVVDYHALQAEQARASHEGAAEFVAAISKRRENFDFSDRSIENKRLICQSRYRPILGEHVTRELLSPDGDTMHRYGIIMNQFSDWAKGEQLDDAKNLFPGWTSEDFVDMIKILEADEVEVRNEVTHKLSEAGVDAEALKEQIRKAEAAKNALNTAQTRLLYSFGVNPHQRLR
jgi:hypothetical protein